MLNVLTWLSRRRFPYETLITVEVSRGRLLHNLNEFRKIAPRDPETGLRLVAPVLKANAYGHGLSEVARILAHEKGIPFVVVDSYFEAVALRSYGLPHEILVIGYTRPETILSSRLRKVVFTVTSLETLESLEQTDWRLPIHLKIDTGMHRQGILPDQVNRASELLSENPLIELRGLCSHLADADNTDPSMTEGQIAIWNKIARRFKSDFASLRYTHLSATDGHRYTADIEANVSRLGLGLYGLADGSAFTPRIDLHPVLEMKTIITGIKRISRDQSIGYGGTYKAPRQMTVATIPVGYFEGIDRRLSNVGFVELDHKGAHCPIVGRVSMNITSIDISSQPDIGIGSVVTAISNTRSDPNSIESMARLCATIPYEIAVHIPAHLKRLVVS
ncbi:MAG: alanine racemase [Patescibacteria group bacterium]|nr:alanine racemase [Patescibacteria group bacterium]